jgi:MFS family permease
VVSIKELLRLSDGALGIALLGGAIGSVIATPLCGALLGRFGARRMTRFSGVVLALSLVPPGVAWNLPTLLAALVLFGMASGMNDVSMNAQAVATERLIRARAISRFHSLFSIGAIAGSFIGAAVAGRGISPLSHFAVSCALLIALSLSGSRLMPDLSASSEKPPPFKLRRLPLALFALSAAGFCSLLSEGAIADWTGVFLRQIMHTSEAFAPVGFGVFSVSMSIFRMTGDRITQALGEARAVRLGGLTAAAGIALMISVSNRWVALAGLAAAGAGFSSIVPLVFAAGGRVKTLGEGGGVAAVTGVGYLGFLVGPPAIGFIAQASNLRWGLFLLVLLSVAAAWLAGVVERRAPELWRV